MSRTTESGKLPALDGLRGIAVLMVMLYHWTILPPSNFDAPAFSLLGSGWMGVDLFFVISGFLITGILLDSKGQKHYYKNFWIRRSLRILPLYYLFLFLVFAVMPLFVKVDTTETGPINPLWYWALLSNIYYSVKAHWIHATLDCTWSLSIEEQFYWFWPFAVALLSRQNIYRLCLGLIALAPICRTLLWYAGTEPIHGYVLTFCRTDALAFGGLIAIFWRSGKPKTYFLKLGRTFTFTTALPLVAMLLYRNGDLLDPLVRTAGLTIIGFFFTGLLCLALSASTRGNFHRALITKPLLFLGKYSYCLYLCHLPIRNLMRTALFPPEALLPYMGTYLFSQVLFYIACAVPTLFVAFCSYHLYEKHFLKLKDKFAVRTLKPKIEKLAA